jgi:hypothetical protein
MQDIIDGEMEIDGEGSMLARQAVELYRAVILRRLMVQQEEDVIPVDYLRKAIQDFCGISQGEQLRFFDGIVETYKNEKENNDD